MSGVLNTKTWEGEECQCTREIPVHNCLRQINASLHVMIIDIQLNRNFISRWITQSRQHFFLYSEVANLSPKSHPYQVLKISTTISYLSYSICSTNELVIIFIHQSLHAGIKASDRWCHFSFFIHEFCKGLFQQQLIEVCLRLKSSTIYSAIIQQS